MTKVTINSKENINIEFELKKVTRATEVGEKHIIYKDKDDKILKRASISSDGINIILSKSDFQGQNPALKYNYVDSKGNYVDPKDIVSIDEKNQILNKIPANANEIKNLQYQVDINDIFNFKITSCFQLFPKEKNKEFLELYNKLLKTLNDGGLFLIPFSSSSGGFTKNEAFLIPLENENILLEIGFFNEPRFFSRSESFENEEDIEEATDYDVQDLFEEAF